MSTKPRLVERGVGVGQAGEARHPARDRGGELGLERRLELEPGFAQAHGDVDEAGADDAAGGVDDAVGNEARRRRADGDDPAGLDAHRRRAVEAARRIDHAAVADLELHRQFPATMLITAMRTAMPNVTCGRITAWSPSATAESISTPRFIGPGCMTMASGFASASFSGVRP